MENKINIANLLKKCPKGMELDCIMYEDVYFDYVDKLNIIHCYIQHETYKTFVAFSQHGQYVDADFAKCVIFPKGKTSWEGFVPPGKFKDGDILFVKYAYDWICIYKESENDEDLYIYVATPIHSYYTHIVYEDDPLCYKEDISEIRFATEEEKAKLFDAIKANGYKWNPETKTLEKLVEPKFKVGDRIKYRYFDSKIAKVVKIHDKRYELDNGKFIEFQDEQAYEISYDKFDITTLKPFESRVLVRDTDTEVWKGGFYSHYESKKFYIISDSYYYQCIPYEGNEHLLGKTDNCDDFYKTW